jgi:hypothetical protein
MPLPTGQWNIVSGGYNGILNITRSLASVFRATSEASQAMPGEESARVLVTLPLTVTGTLQLDPTVTLDISGTWNEAHQSDTRDHLRTDSSWRTPKPYRRCGLSVRGLKADV